jgi:hypothetical protein
MGERRDRQREDYSARKGEGNSREGILFGVVPPMCGDVPPQAPTHLAALPVRREHPRGHELTASLDAIM